MPQAKLKIPTLYRQVKEGEKEYHYEVRPLFFPHPTAQHRRYDRAQTIFMRELRTYFSSYVFSRAQADTLLWFSFHPEVKYEQFKFKFTLNGTFVDGTFGAAHFHLQGNNFVVLPAFDDYMFIAKKDGTALYEQVLAVVRKQCKNLQGDKEIDFDWQDYVVPQREFVRSVDLSISIENGSFGADDGDTGEQMALIGGSEQFSGPEELSKTGFALNHLYPTDLGQAFFREEITAQVQNILFGKENTPFVLVGNAGVGKHAIIHQTVRNYLEEGNHEDESHNDHLWHIDPSRVISGMSVVGQWERRFETIIKYLQSPIEGEKRSDKILIDNAVALLRIGQSAQSKMNLAGVLKPYLEQRTLQVVLLATPEEWKIVQEKDRGFADLFQVVRLQEPDAETVAKIVLKQRRYLERRENARFTMMAIRHLFTIQRNFLKNQSLPGSLLKLMEQLVTKYSFQTIDAAEVRAEFENFSGYREEIFDQDAETDARELHNFFANRLVGQPKAVERLTDLVHAVKAKLTNKSKPLGSFLFIGPTGVGKTQAAKVLASYLMGNQDRLLRFDMNEYIDPFAVNRLIGDYNNPEGQLTGKVRYQPFSILLLDEIEKANPAVHDLLLQVLDDGRLTDSIGRTVDFTNTIIIMTSNLGANEVSSRLGFGSNAADEGAIYRKAVELKFRPEFINRIGQIVIFNPLELEHILGIAQLQIGELLERDGFVRRTTILNISPDALEWVARRGFDGKMGGRALKRQIERDLTELSAAQLVTTYSEQPIIFEIALEKDKLVPHIQPLEFVDDLEKEVLPEIPEIARGRGFYNKLLRDLEFLERKIRRVEPPESGDVIQIGEEGGSRLNWQYYDFKDRIVGLKEQITTLSLGFRDSRFSVQLAIPLRLKTSIAKDDSWSATRIRFKDRIFQEEALNELSDNYNLGNPEFDSVETEFIDSYLNVAYLRLAAQGFLHKKTDKIVLEFHSLINNKGQEEIEFLCKSYVAFFEEMNIDYNVAKDKCSIQAEAYSLHKILKGEEGLHLFYKEHRNPIPVRSSIRTADKKSDKRLSMKVLRIYAHGTMTDLRTGFSNAKSVSAREMKLLIYAGTI